MAHKIDSTSAAVVMPTPAAAGTGGWFTDGNPGLGVPGTVVTADWLNAYQAEILNVLTAAGITPDKTKQNQLLTAIYTIARIKLTAALTIYVATTGNDTTGNGTSGLPFATLNRAWSHLLASYDCNGHQVTIQMANGTYNTPFVAYAPPVGAFNGPVIIQGNTGNSSSCIINVTNATAMYFTNSGPVIVRGFRLIAGGTSTTYATNGNGIVATGASSVYISHMDFGACGHAHLYSSWSGVIALYNATANFTVPYTISGGAQIHALAADNSIMSLIGGIVTLTGTPAFSNSYAVASFGQLHIYGSSFTGSATGKRYTSGGLGMINTNGSGATYLPGNVAGDVDSLSVYY